MLRILYDDFAQKVKNIHDEMDLHHSYKIKSVYLWGQGLCIWYFLWIHYNSLFEC